MKKNLFVYLFIALLMATLVIVPLVGVDYYDSASICDVTSPVLSLGGGSRVTLKFEDDSLGLQKEDYDQAAATLKKRFDTLGYSDTVVEAKDESIVVDVAIKNFVKDSVRKIASAGKWTFSDLYQGTTLSLNASDFEDVIPVSSGSSNYVRIEFTSDGLSKFNSQVSGILNSGVPYLNFNVDEGTDYGWVSLNENFSGSYLYVQVSDSATVCSFLSSDPLPSAMEVTAHEAIEPTSGAVRTILIVACAVVAVVLLAVLILMGKRAGVFSALALIGVGLVYLVAFANYRFSLSWQGLIFVGVTLLLLWAFYLWVNLEIGAELKRGRSLSGALSAKLGKITLRGLIIHGSVIFVSLLLLIFFSGAFSTFLRALLWGTLANVVLYFLVFYLGVNAVAESK